jgi:ribosomal-protein-serine acetyltransferase
MKLEATGIYLRPPASEDADALASAIRESIETVGRWMPWAVPDYGRGHSLEWIERATKGWVEETAFEFTIFDPATDEVLGCCGLNRIDPMNKSANLGYWVRQSHHGRGIASTAAARVARYGLEERGFNRVEICAAVENVASQRVAEKAGARREAVLRNRILLATGPVDAVMFSLIPGDLD